MAEAAVCVAARQRPTRRPPDGRPAIRAVVSELPESEHGVERRVAVARGQVEQPTAIGFLIVQHAIFSGLPLAHVKAHPAECGSRASNPKPERQQARSLLCSWRANLRALRAPPPSFDLGTAFPRNARMRSTPKRQTAGSVLIWTERIKVVNLNYAHRQDRGDNRQDKQPSFCVGAHLALSFLI